MITRKQLAQSTVDWLGATDWKYFVTLTFDKDISDNQANKELRVFLKRLNNSLYGRRSKRAIKVAPFKEHTKDDRPHFHLLLGCHESTKINDLMTLVFSTWDKSFVTSNYHLILNEDWFQHIEQESKEMVVRYCLKQAGRDIDSLELEDLVL